MEHREIGTIIGLIVLVLIGYWFLNSPKAAMVSQSITNFTQCQGYGYPITNSYPRQCRTPGGQIFTEGILTAAVVNSAPTTTAVYPSYTYPTYPVYTGPKAYITYPIATSSTSSSYSAPRNYSTSSSYYVASPSPTYTSPAYQGGCFISGCSNQICSDQPGAISTCEYRPDYACYQYSTCERQATGQCGWTPTPGLISCLNNTY